MLVGSTGSAKTTAYEILEDTMNYLREKGDPDKSYQFVKKIILNPKAISMNEMYGYVNSSQEWFDGLASKVMRVAAQETGDEKTWVVFDGPVDAIWIENMNTVLDDNMTLCLSNGQRIKLRHQMRMLFEVNDLLVASPATVSRCGMVYLTPEELGWKPYVKTWIATFFTDDYVMSAKMKDFLWSTFDATIDIALEFIRQNCKEAIRTTDLQQVVSVCNFLEGFIDTKAGFKGSDEEKIPLLNCLFAWSYTWGIGGSLDQAGKDRFDSIVRDQFKSAQFPSGFTVFDYWYDLKKEKIFKPWTLKVKPFIYDKDLSYFDLMVPTQDTTKYSYCLNHLMLIEKPIFFTGSSGIGKTAIIANVLAEYKESGSIVPININMSAQTTSLRT
jgi:dynein heavy chain